jgi:competence protein ComEA
MRIREYLKFHPRERQGIIACAFLSLIIWFTPEFVAQISERNNAHKPIAMVKAQICDTVPEVLSQDSIAESMISDVADLQDVSRETLNEPVPGVSRPLPDSIDANNIPDSLVRKLPVSEGLKKSWINYRAKGGFFRSRDDFLKLYGLREDDYRKLAAKLRFPPREIRIDINSASMAEWQLLSGIGPYYAKRIVNFRDKLGGFVRISQIAETYGLPDSVYQSITGQLILSPLTRKIPINRVTADEMKAHPYLSWKEAEWIANYRTQHGAFGSLEDLRQLRLLSEETIEKIGPYIDFSEGPPRAR